MKTKCIALFVLLIWTSLRVCAGTVDVGMTLRGVLPIVEKNDADIYATLPLPEGDWTVIFTSTSPSTNGSSQFRNVSLYQVDGDRVRQYIYVHVKVQGASTRWNDEPCKASSVLYKNDYGTRLWKQKCLVVRASTFLQNDNELSKSTLAELSAKAIKTDLNSLLVKYTRYGDGDKFYVIEIHVFPSAYGLENPVISVQTASPWYVDNYTNDPEKVRFVDALKAYAEDVVTDFDRAYETGSAVRPMRAFTFNDTGQAAGRAIGDRNSGVNPERPVGGGASSNVEKRLSTLKKVYEQGLLSKEEYDDKRKSILNSL